MIDLKGKTIYPSFIDLYSSFGILLLLSAIFTPIFSLKKSTVDESRTSGCSMVQVVSRSYTRRPL